MPATLELTVSSNAAALAAQFAAFAKDQLPFGTALALTRLGALVQRGGREQLPKKFTVRAQWMVKAMATTLVRKGDWPNQQVNIGHPFWPMKLHEVGGEKTGGHVGEVYIPTRAMKSMLSPTTGKLPVQFQAHKLLAAGKAEEVTMPGRLGRVIMLRRAVSARRRNADKSTTILRLPANLRIAFLIRSAAKIKAAFGFFPLAEATVRSEYERLFVQAMEEAIATRRVKVAGGAHGP